MKNIYLLFAVIILAGCRRETNTDILNVAAIKYSGDFITKNIPSIPTLRIMGRPTVKGHVNDSTYQLTGMVEGFSPYNYAVSTEYFSESLHYLGGDPNDHKSWECMEIYVGKKKMK